MKPDLNSTTDEILTRLCKALNDAMDKFEACGELYTGLVDKHCGAASKAMFERERNRVKKIEDVILSDPEGSSKFLSFRAACSRATLNRHRARLRREGKVK